MKQGKKLFFLKQCYQPFPLLQYRRLKTSPLRTPKTMHFHGKLSHSGFEGEGGENKGMNVLVLAIA